MQVFVRLLFTFYELRHPRRRIVWEKRRPRDLRGGGRRCSVQRRGLPGPRVLPLYTLGVGWIDWCKWPTSFLFCDVRPVSSAHLVRSPVRPCHSFTIGIMVLRITGQPVGSVITADEVGASSIFSFCSHFIWTCLCIWPLYIQSLLLLTSNFEETSCHRWERWRWEVAGPKAQRLLPATIHP